jgi:hypothetical protein
MGQCARRYADGVEAGLDDLHTRAIDTMQSERDA